MDEQIVFASQQFNGGIMVVSFIIATIGAQTTLELLGRRTHMNGTGNWLLLSAAAVAMGGVGIWSMHFIGNNSLSLTYKGDYYHLTYSAGYTFASLAVAIGCMFVAFAFVGITEEAKVSRIVPSGVIAGIGIVCMHYIGQFAIKSFHLHYKIPYIAGASVIACVAVVTALYIFFKLREKWVNRWYKRVGSSLLMGLAVCGMHYTAMAGTEYSVPPDVTPTTSPVFSRDALIGTISANVVVACGLLLFIAVRAGVVHLPTVNETKSHRLILDAVFFDRTGKILVNVDGRVPNREILAEFQPNSTHGSFNSSHPLFLRFFEATCRWAKRDTNGDKGSNRLSEQLSIHTRNSDDLAEDSFIDAARDLVAELRFISLADLGIMFDGVLCTNTIPARRNNFLGSFPAKKANTNSRSPKKTGSPASMLQTARQNKHKRLSSISSFDTFESAVVLEHGDNQHPENSFFAGAHPKKRFMKELEQATIENTENHRQSLSSPNIRISEANDNTQKDHHVVVVRQISKKEQTRLLSQGYRFADPVFISKTMGEHLKIPADHMSLYFNDMKLFAQSSATLLQITSSGPVVTSGACSSLPLADVSPPGSFDSENDTIPDEATKGSVYIGLSALFQEDRENDPTHIHIMVDKTRRYAFPMIQLTYDDAEVPVQLSREERSCILSLSGQSLQNVCSLESHLQMLRENGGNTLFDGCEQSVGDWATRSGATTRFIRALEGTSRKLMAKSVYGKPLASLAKLHGDVIDIPPFSLTLGPCQLILFRAWVTSPGNVSAVNQTLHETTKCIPIPLYRSLAYHTTDQAVFTYKSLVLRKFPESAYMAQQRVYQSAAVAAAAVTATATASYPPTPLHHPPPDVPLPPLPQKQADEKILDETNKPPRGLSEIVSLPPPPRARKPKIQLPLGGRVSLSDLEDVAEKSPKAQSPAAPHTIELPTILTILPTVDRFWWLNNVIDETMHGHNTVGNFGV